LLKWFLDKISERRQEFEIRNAGPIFFMEKCAIVDYFARICNPQRRAYIFYGKVRDCRLFLGKSQTGVVSYPSTAKSMKRAPNGSNLKQTPRLRLWHGKIHEKAPKMM